jgi:simple sugar transport system permease protein
LAPLIALLLAFLISAIFVRLAGKSPLEAGQSLFQGATGLEIHLRPWHVSFYAGRLAESLAKTIPLIMTGLSVAVAFRAGFFNIGAEGQFLMGALVATALGTRTGAGAPLLLVVGALAGAVWSLIAGVLKTWRGAPEIITTIMLNYIALQIVVFAVQGPLQERVEHPDPQTDMLPLHAQLSPLMPNTTLHSGLIVALVCAVACWWLLYRTERGFLFRAVGAGPVASQVHGINVERNVLYTVALSGAMAGLGGAMEIAGVTKYMVGQGFDYGYTAIAVALLAGLDPLAVVPAALLFGMLNAGGGSMERNTGVPAVTVSIIAGIIICLIAAIPRLRRSLNTVA